MEGITAWVDLGIPYTPHFLNGLGVEIEGRDINWGRPSSTPTMRHDTIAGGPIYSISRFGRLQPYAKYLIGIGSIDFPASLALPRHTGTIHAQFMRLVEVLITGSTRRSGCAPITSINSGRISSERIPSTRTASHLAPCLILAGAVRGQGFGSGIRRQTVPLPL